MFSRQVLQNLEGKSARPLPIDHNVVSLGDLVDEVDEPIPILLRRNGGNLVSVINHAFGPPLQHFPERVPVHIIKV